MSDTQPEEEDELVWTPAPVASPKYANGHWPTVEEREANELTYPQPESIPICDVCSKRHVTVFGTVSCVEHIRSAMHLPCHAAPVRGLVKCQAHTTRKAIRKVKQTAAEARAAKSLHAVGINPIGNPIDELATLAAEILAVKDHFADVVGELRDQLRFTDDKGAEQLDARVALYERALDRSQKVLTDLARVGFEEQKLRLDEQRAALVFVFIHGLLTELGLSFDDVTVRLALERWSPVLDGDEQPEELVYEDEDEDVVDAELVE